MSAASATELFSGYADAAAGAGNAAKSKEPKDGYDPLHPIDSIDRMSNKVFKAISHFIQKPWINWPKKPVREMTDEEWEDEQDAKHRHPYHSEQPAYHVDPPPEPVHPCDEVYPDDLVKNTECRSLKDEAGGSIKV